MNKFTVRLAKKEDAHRVWELRNDPISRAWSKSQAEIPFNEPWFLEKYFGHQKNLCFVLEDQGKVIAYCRMDAREQEDGFVVSIAVDSGLLGQGLGTKVLSEGIKLFTKRPLLAEIKKGNAISLKLFQKQGFEITHERGDFLELILR